jgi:cupin 2 domain-containing protein
MSTGNLFANLNRPAEGERFDTLLAHKSLVIERILSSAKTTPFEYIQPQDEWVILLQGQAVMDVAGRTRKLESGDYLFLPAGVPHTVQHVSEGALWLAVHLHAPTSDGS